MFRYGYSEALNRLVSVIAAVVLALTIVGAVEAAEASQAASTPSGFICSATLA